ncbi:unnamed protein product [Brassica napus]|uniref:(rape) hypothetical protein n=1 Tax=Brassica napus TaxID=3708 RepID=A0A816KRS0_BRANA|nr:unnamed protein product [Brassica napus]
MASETMTKTTRTIVSLLRYQRKRRLKLVGVKDDLTELSHTLTRKFRGVANFLAPLPERSSSDQSNPRLSRSRSPDLGLNQSCVAASDTREAEIRARSWNSTTMEEKDSCNDPEEEEEEMDARNIAMHPETWLDFPLDPEEDLDGNLHSLIGSAASYQIHALAIESLAPRLAALRIELCPCHMTVGYFWKVMEARALWMKELQNQNNSTKTGRGDFFQEEIKPSTSSCYHHAPPEFLSPRIYAFEPPSIVYPDFQKTVRWSENVEFIDKAVIEEKPIQKIDKNILEGDDDISSLALKSKSTAKNTDQKGT